MRRLPALFFAGLGLLPALASAADMATDAPAPVVAAVPAPAAASAPATCTADQPRRQACVDAVFRQMGPEARHIASRYLHAPAFFTLIYTLDIAADGRVSSVQINAAPATAVSQTYLDHLRQLVSSYDFGPAAAAAEFTFGLSTGIAD